MPPATKARGILTLSLVGTARCCTVRARKAGATNKKRLRSKDSGGLPPGTPGRRKTDCRSKFAASTLALATHHYIVQWTADLANNNWTDLFTNLAGGGVIQSVTDPATNAPDSFYRLKVLTP